MKRKVNAWRRLPFPDGAHESLRKDRILMTDFNLTMLNLMKEKRGKSARQKANEMIAEALQMGYQSPPELL